MAAEGGPPRQPRERRRRRGDNPGTHARESGGRLAAAMGRSLYFLRRDGEILRADRLAVDDLAYAVPVPVLTVPGLRDFDTAHHSARIVAVVPETSAGPAAVDAFLDWMSALVGPK